MLRYYYEKKYLIVSLLVVLFDGVILYFIPSYLNKLNYFYPMLTISLIPFIRKKQYLLVIVMGIIYDLLYSNIFLYHVLLFIILFNLDNKISKYFKNSLMLFIMLALLNIIVYDTIGFLLIMITNYQKVSFHDLIYKIDHSIILNILSVFVFYFLLKKDSCHA